MAITLTTSAQVVGSNQDGGFKGELLAWYSDKSGNNATVHVALRVTFIDSNYAYYYGTNKNYTLNFNGTSSAQYSPSMNINEGVTMAERTQSVAGGSSISASGSWYSYNYGSFNINLSQTVNLPVFATKPATPTVSASTGTATTTSVTYGTTSFGTPNSGTVYLYGGTGSAPTGSITSKTTTGNSTFTHSGLASNTRYYYRARAYNNQLWSDYSSTVNAVTKAQAPTISFRSATTNTITMNFSVKADGGVYPKTLQYSLNNSTFTTYATFNSGSATSGTFTIMNLTAGTPYTIYTRVTTTAGTVNANSITVRTQQASYAPYPNNPNSANIAKQIKKLLAPRSGLARQVVKLYDSYNGKARRVL